MPVRIKLPSKSESGAHKPSATWVKIRNGIAITLGVFVIATAIFLSFSYEKYARLTDAKLAHGPFPKSSMLYAAPEVVGVGDPGTPLRFASRLRESGLAEDARTNPIGWYHLRPNAIEIFPGADAFTHGDPGVLHFENGKISSIMNLSDNSSRTEYTLEPQLLSTLYDKNREKRRIVKYNDIPPVLVHALISAEDKRFFQHSGFDPIRVVKAVLDDLGRHKYFEGASTLTQQLSRMLWLDNRKTISRKYAELMITLHLEQKLSKEQILEYYSNQVPLGQLGSFSIRGFGEASQAYFNKDIRQLTLPEAATLAGLIQQPSFRNPVRWPERARKRRDVVMRMMLDNGYISKLQYEDALNTPMVTVKQGAESADAPYFVDLVNERLSDEFQDKDFQESGSRIYTTLDPLLQRDAAEAVVVGMKEVDTILAKRHKNGTPYESPQVALICLDPHTGEVKALIGGKNYGVSQFDHAVAKRPSGSIFKPFVYAAALNSGLWDHPNAITASTILQDTPQTFTYDGDKSYEPTDYHKGNWKGDVTLREALADSLNVPAVEVAEKAGLGNVADLAHKAGLTEIKATPAEALGAYDVTAMQMAGAYTLFANNGVMVQPRLLSRIVDNTGDAVWHSEPETKKLLDPRVNFLMVSLMQEVLRSGSGARVASYGFNLPAAGKTGTSHDAWFAGFTSKLLCIVWVGLDDYQDLKVEGAHAALPVWAEFMKRAHKHREYRDVSNFAVPDGVVSAQIDPDSGALATTACPKVITEYYLIDTQPVQFCPLHQGGSTQIASWGAPPPVPSNGSVPVPVLPAGMQPQTPAPYGVAQQNSPVPPPPADQRKKRGGFFDHLKSIFH